MTHNISVEGMTQYNVLEATLMCCNTGNPKVFPPNYWGQEFIHSEINTEIHALMHEHMRTHKVCNEKRAKDTV